MTHQLIQTEATRRQLLTMATVGGAGVLAVTAARPADAASAQGMPGDQSKHDYTLTVLGTTDLHGNVFNWDYFKNAEYTDSKGNDIGVAKASTLIQAMRRERGAENCVTLDAGDTIHYTPLPIPTKLRTGNLPVLRSSIAYSHKEIPGFEDRDIHEDQSR